MASETTISEILEINDLIVQINECERRADEVWTSRKKFSTKHEDRLREKIRPIDLLRERLLAKLWDVYSDYPDDVEFLEERKAFGVKKTEYVWCDGDFHFVTNKSEEFQYAIRCNC